MTGVKILETLCKFQNSGYCKFKENCKFRHVKEKCEEKCDRKTCQKRHQKSCKYGLRCSRLKTCEFKHETNPDEVLKTVIKNLETSLKELVEENKHMKSKMSDLETELRSSQKSLLKEKEEKDTIIKVLREKLHKEETTSAKTRKKLMNKEQEIVSKEKEIESMRINIASSENFKCDQCNFGGKDKRDLIKHKEAKHDEVWLQCTIPDRCKFGTFDEPNFIKHCETIVHNTSAVQ